MRKSSRNLHSLFIVLLVLGTSLGCQSTPTTPTMPTAATVPSMQAPKPAVDVRISKLFSDGLVPSTESDEYVEITNSGSESVNLEGWLLTDQTDGYPEFTFPSYILQPNKSIRVYTNEIHPEYGGFSFGSPEPVWDPVLPNIELGDVAVLFNAQGQIVSRWNLGF